MHSIKKLFLYMALIFSLLPLSACQQNKTAGGFFRYDLSADPGNLDPQISNNTDAFVVLKNIFEGLLTEQPDGSLTEAAAESYTISADQRVYTFTLREDAYWEGEENTPVTANDFVFAFQRLADPATGSPHTAAFQCIEGFSESLAGTASPQSIGVKALDTYTLEFTLSEPSDAFLPALASTAAFPCNEEFFNSTNGKYGLDGYSILCNGPFYLYGWSQNESVTLRKNTDYYDAKNVMPATVVLSVTPEETQRTERFFNGITDVAFLSGSYYEQLVEEEFEIQPVVSTTWSLVFNTQDEDYQNIHLRRALALTVDHTSYQHLLADYMTDATGLIPSAIEEGGINYRTQMGTSMLAYNPTAAETERDTALNELEVTRFPRTTLICPDTANHALILGFLQRQWQQDLSPFINLEPLPMEEYLARLQSGDYQIALVPLTANNNTPDGILSYFTQSSSENYSGYADSSFEALLEQALLTIDTASSYQQYAQAEQILIENAIAVPLYYETSYIAFSKDCANIHFSPFGGNITFRDALIAQN